MADQPGGLQGDTVFCHVCRHDWPRTEHGLTCPLCESDFTEIIERDNDPRQTYMTEGSFSQRPSSDSEDLHTHNPWANEDFGQGPGTVEEHVTQHTGPGGSVQFTRVVIRSDSPRGTRNRPNDSRSPIFDSFQRMMQNIMGAEGANPSDQQRSGPQSPSNERENPFGQTPGGTDHPRRPPPSSGDGHLPPVIGGRITFSTNGNLWPRDANNPQPPNQPVDDLPGILRMLVHDLNGIYDHENRPPPPGGEGPNPGNPILGLFASILNPAGALHGDAVYTQEALDRVITQLMEQHSGSNAPGPASESAIASLPRKKIDLQMLDDEGKAECTICMDEVPVGNEVMSLPCGHWFHEQCGTAWLKEHDTCPICRKGIMPKEGNGNESRMPGQEARHPEPWRTHSDNGGIPGVRFGSSSSSNFRSGPGRSRNSFSFTVGGGTNRTEVSSSPSFQRGGSSRHGTENNTTGASTNNTTTNSGGGGGGVSGRVRGWFGGTGGGGSGSGGGGGGN